MGGNSSIITIQSIEFTSMTVPSSLTLNTGAKMPAISFGTYDVPGPEAYKAVLHALKVGYRHIDTAAYYQNETEIGQAIHDSGIPREEIFVTTKLNLCDFHDVKAAFDKSFNNLNIGYIDLYLMHFPIPLLNDLQTPDPTITVNDAYIQMQDLPKDKVKAIGVSNFDTVNFKTLFEDKRFSVVPAANQIERHPHLVQQKLIDFHKKHGIITQAYSSLARGDIFKNVSVDKIAKKHGISASNVAVAWALQQGTVPLVKSVTPARIEENLKVFKLDDEDMAEIAGLGKTVIRIVNPWPSANCFHDDVDTK